VGKQREGKLGSDNAKLLLGYTKKSYRKYSNTWRLNNTLLNDM
jgi:hypothetical protein